MNDNSLQQAQGQTGFLSSDVEELIKSQIGSQTLEFLQTWAELTRKSLKANKEVLFNSICSLNSLYNFLESISTSPMVFIGHSLLCSLALSCFQLGIPSPQKRHKICPSSTSTVRQLNKTSLFAFRDLRVNSAHVCRNSNV